MCIAHLAASVDRGLTDVRIQEAEHVLCRAGVTVVAVLPLLLLLLCACREHGHAIREDRREESSMQYSIATDPF